jgi:hypothetical protein
MKPEPDPDMNESAVRDLITKRMAAENADSGWAIAYTALLFLPVLKSINEKLEMLNWLNSLRGVESLGAVAEHFQELTHRRRREALAIENAIWESQQKRERERR